jgi:adenylate kinase family enzyme
MTSRRSSRDWLDAAAKVLASDENGLRALAKIAGGQPSSFYRGANLRGADLRGQDLRGIDFTGADLSDVQTDDATRFGACLDILLTGPMALGKSFQAQRIGQSWGLLPIMQDHNVHNGLRAGGRVGTSLGYSPQQLDDDQEIFAAIESALDRPECYGGIVFDDWPRDILQARELDTILGRHGRRIGLAIALITDWAGHGTISCSDCGEIIDPPFHPVLDDGLCENCRSPSFGGRPTMDTSLSAHVNVFDASVSQLLSYYQERELLLVIDASRGPKSVAHSIDTAIEQLTCDALVWMPKPDRRASSPGHDKVEPERKLDDRLSDLADLFADETSAHDRVAPHRSPSFNLAFNEATPLREHLDLDWSQVGEKLDVDTIDYEGLQLSSRYSRVHEFNAMKGIVDALPDRMRNRIASIFCDSKACAVYSITIRAGQYDPELPGMLRMAGIAIGGHNGMMIEEEGVSKTREFLPPDWEEPGPPIL